MGIQFNQIDNLQSYFDSVSGNLQTQITAAAGPSYAMASGTFAFKGQKYFEGNVDFSGAQGILIDPNNVYTPNTVFAGELKIGGGLATPRNTTTGPEGVMQVTGGASYFEGDVHIRNNGQLNALVGSFSESLTISGVSVSTGAAGGGGGNPDAATEAFALFTR